MLVFIHFVKFALFAVSDGRVVSDNLETNKSQIVFLCQ